MSSNIPHFIIIAGEASGDAHAAHLVTAIRTLTPKATFSGLGGQEMKKAGVEIYHDMTRIAVVGFVEVLNHLGEFRRLFALVLDQVQKRKPAAVILVDYPGFNLRLAREVKRLGVKVFYYISPQVWAWKENRVRIVKEFTDRMLVLFKFEKDFYARHGIEVDFVGHPLIDAVRTTKTRETFLASLGFSPGQTTIGLLPGSRQKEVSSLLLPMLEAAKIIHDKDPKTQFVILQAATVPSATFSDIVCRFPSLPLRVVQNDFYNGLNACDVCLVASGTATLETAILDKPMVVVYKTSFLTWLLARLLIKIPYIGLANVVAGKSVVPECVQFDATGKKLAEELTGIYQDPRRMQAIKEDLRAVTRSLGEPGANQRAAEVVVKSV